MKSLALFAVLLLCHSLAAHSVWIEPDAGGRLVVRFAEPDGKLEKSPGHLDELTLPRAWQAGASNAPMALTVEKQRDHFALGHVTASAAVQIETEFQVIAAPGRPGRRPHFYARWHPAGAGAAAPALTLDLVPTGQAGEVRVVFRGKPLGGVRATLRPPDGKEQELTADGEGFLRFASPQAGQHLLSVAHHRETLGGFAGGRAYDLTSHNAALTWRQP